MKKSNNKGFSLVELIVVVAIMAVLVGVLAPAYMRYVEKARLQKDNSAIAEIAEAMKVASADEKVSAVIDPTNGYTVTIVNDTNADNATVDFSGAADAMEVELNGVIGSFTSASKTYAKSATDITIKITTDDNGKTAIVTTGIITTPNATSPDATQPTF